MPGCGAAGPAQASPASASITATRTLRMPRVLRRSRLLRQRAEEAGHARQAAVAIEHAHVGAGHDDVAIGRDQLPPDPQAVVVRVDRAGAAEPVIRELLVDRVDHPVDRLVTLTLEGR